MNKHLEQWFGSSVFSIPITRNHRRWIEAIAGCSVVFGIFCLFAFMNTVIASATVPGCQTENCTRVDVLFAGPRIKAFTIGGCVYEAHLYNYGSLISSNKFRFESGCPDKISLKWNNGAHCTIFFDQQQAQVRFQGNNTEWKMGTL